MGSQSDDPGFQSHLGGQLAESPQTNHFTILFLNIISQKRGFSYPEELLGALEELDGCSVAAMQRGLSRRVPFPPSSLQHAEDPPLCGESKRLSTTVPAPLIAENSPPPGVPPEGSRTVWGCRAQIEQASVSNLPLTSCIILQKLLTSHASVLHLCKPRTMTELMGLS